MKKKVAVLFGGCSEEHDVSIKKFGNISIQKNMIPFISVFPDLANGSSVKNRQLTGMKKPRSV